MRRSQRFDWRLWFHATASAAQVYNSDYGLFVCPFLSASSSPEARQCLARVAGSWGSFHASGRLARDRRWRSCTGRLCGARLVRRSKQTGHAEKAGASKPGVTSLRSPGRRAMGATMARVWAWGLAECLLSRSWRTHDEYTAACFEFHVASLRTRCRQRQVLDNFDPNHPSLPTSMPFAVVALPGLRWAFSSCPTTGCIEHCCSAVSTAGIASWHALWLYMCGSSELPWEHVQVPGPAPACPRCATPMLWEVDMS